MSTLVLSGAGMAPFSNESKMCRNPWHGRRASFALCEKLMVLLFSLVTNVSGSFASEYHYYPPFLRIGAGLDTKNPTEPFPYCFTFSTAPIESTAVGSIFTTSLLSSRKELLTQLGLSASISGHYQFFSGGVSADYGENFSSASDSLSWIVKVTTDYGRREIIGEKVKPEFSTLMKDKPNEFAERCGTELVTEERRSATVAAIFTINHLSEERQRQLSASFSGGVTAAAWDAKAQASYRSFSSEAARTSAVRLDVVTIGGVGAAALAPLLTDFADLDKITSTLRSYTEKLSFDSAAPTSFITTGMKRYGWKGQTLDFSTSDLALGDYYLRYRDAEALRQRVDQLTSTENTAGADMPDEKRQYLAEVSKKSEAILYSLIKQAGVCRKDDSGCLPVSNFPLPNVRWPNLDVLRSATVARSSISCDPALPGLVVASGELNYLCSLEASLDVVLNPSKVNTLSVQTSLGSDVPIGSSSDLGLKSWTDGKIPPNADTSTIARRKSLLSTVAAEDISDADLSSSPLVVRSVSIKIPFGSAISQPKSFSLFLKLTAKKHDGSIEERDVVF